MPEAHTHTNLYIYLAIMIFIHKHTTWLDACKQVESWRGATSPIACPSSNRARLSPYTLMKMSFCCAELPHRGTEEDMSKLLASFSLSISIVQNAEVSLTDLIHTLGHTWVDRRRKEGVFNPILPARWHCSGKLLFFAWERSKSLALFCLWCLGLKLPSFHGLLIAWQHQSK